MSIGVIGNGRFGQLIAKHLNVTLYDIDPNRSLNSLKEVMLSENVILAVPMRELENTCKTIKPLLFVGQHILDVCSLKMFSKEIMNRVLGTPIVFATGLHPLFGPQSARDSVKGQRIVITDYGHSKVQCVSELCQKLELDVIIASVEEHDKQMAASQALLHFIGRVVEKGFLDKKIEEQITMRTKSYDDMLSIINLVRGGSQELFEDMQTLNLFAGAMRDDFIALADEINARL